MDAESSILPGALRSLKQAIEAKLAGDVACKVLPIGNTSVLQLDDHETIKGLMIAVVEMNSADEYFIAVPLTVPFDCNHPKAVEIEAAAARFCEEHRIILDREEDEDGRCRFAFGLRFNWARQIGECGRNLARELEKLRDVYDSSDYDNFQSDIADLLC